MQKKIKMLTYGEPGVGKSVFALGFPKPFFVCTDGNYEWLDEFGAKPEAHVNVSSWVEMKNALQGDFDGHDTIVVDLLEDGFKWCEQEYCIRNKIEHVSDIGYGKAYDATRNEFFIEISKLLAKDKHVVLICHSITFTTKDRRGVEHTKYAPSSRIPDKVLDMIEGRVRYCLRCYMAAEEEPNGKIIKRRFLSLVPKENEFGIIWGVDENLIPHDIPLDFNEFAKALGFNLKSADTSTTTKPKAKDVEVKVETTSEEKPVKKKPVVEKVAEPVEPVEEDVAKPMDMKAKIAALKAKKAAATNAENVEKANDEEITEENATETTEVTVNADAPYVDKNVQAVSTPKDAQAVDSDNTDEETSETETETVAVSTNDKLAAIKAKLAAMKAKK